MADKPNFDEHFQHSLEHHRNLTSQHPAAPQPEPEQKPKGPESRLFGGFGPMVTTGIVLAVIGGMFWNLSSDADDSVAPPVAAPSMQAPEQVQPSVDPAPQPEVVAPPVEEVPVPETTVDSDAAALNAPTPGVGEKSAPLGVVPVVDNPSDAWVPLRTRDDGSPVTWSPCRAIHYVVREDGQVEGGDAMVADALSAITAHTGLQFINDGTTDEAPVADREGFQPDRYGDRWAPVLIAWTNPEETSALNGDTIGQGGPISVWSSDSPATYVSGQVVLDSPQIAETLRYDGGKKSVSAVIEHELSHLVGLGHVEDDSQLMYPKTTQNNQGFGDGDLTGLAAMGSGSCNAKI